MGWYGNRLLLATPLIGVTLAFPGLAAAHARTHNFNLTARSRQTLRALGYSQVHISCHKQNRCDWKAVRRGRDCSGETTVRGRTRRRVRVEDVRCARPRTTAPSPFLFGFNAYTTPTTVQEEKTVGGTVARLIVPWYQAEPSNGTWDWNQFDQQYQEILQGGLRPLIVADGAPCWAEASCNLTFSEPPVASYDSDWSTYVHQLAARYPKAVAIEIWNEPNLASSWYPQADPQRYTQLLKDAYSAVKSVNPAMPVLSGGILMSDGSGAYGPGYASQTFLADMYADGAQHWMDGLAIHVYPTDRTSPSSVVWDPAAMSRWLQQVADVGKAAGVKDMPIWITEMGVSTTTEPGFPAAVTPAQQAADLMTMLQTAQANKDIRMALIDTLQDADPNLLEDLISNLTGPLINYDVFYNQLIEGLGVFYDNWAPKPAACDISKAFGGSLSC